MTDGCAWTRARVGGQVAIELIGRLTLRNPAYVMPSLRKTLIQLLTELEFSSDSRNKARSVDFSRGCICARVRAHACVGVVMRPF